MATISWSRGISGLFASALDWNPKRVPTASDDVAITAPGAYTVTVSANATIKTITTAKNVTVAIKSGDKLDVLQGTTGVAGAAGAIDVASGGALEIGGTFVNSGSIELGASGRGADLIVTGKTNLSGAGRVVLSDNAANAIVGQRTIFPILGPLPTLNVSNAITGAGAIGAGLILDNSGSIVGDGVNAALILNTGSYAISNFGLIDGATAKGVVIDSNLRNGGELEASGTDASLTIAAAVTNLLTPSPFGPHGAMAVSGAGAHIDLAHGALIDGALTIGAGDLVDTVAGSGTSALTSVGVSGAGTLQANAFSTLTITGGVLANGVGLATHGLGSALFVDTEVGAASATIDGGALEFGQASAANVAFAPGAAGVLKLDSSFTGAVSGLTIAPTHFSALYTFGDSTVDAGALRYLSPDIGDADLTARLQNALANGGADSPVGVGAMNPQDLAALFGLSADTAYTTGGVIGGGGTDYAISGALDAADTGNGSDPGNKGFTNILQTDSGAGPVNPAVLSTVAQIDAYLASTGGVADPNALYYISSGANDVAYAEQNLGGGASAYLAAQAKTLAGEIAKLSAAGAQHILVNDVMNDKTDSLLNYSALLYGYLNADGVVYTATDGRDFNQTVINHAAAYGFTSVSTSDPALISPDSTTGGGFGLWGADTTTPQASGAAVDQYAYLSSATAEQTDFFSDAAGHLSTAGQQAQADFNYDLLTSDRIDLTNLAYDPVTTTASFSGNATQGVLTVSSASQSEAITLLGDFTHAEFVTASDGAINPTTGATGTLVMLAATPAPDAKA